MKTPEEIKRGLENCRDTSNCSWCPNSHICELERDALAYIQQLERERDALINIVKRTDIVCLYCKFFQNGCTKLSKEIRLNGDCFEWRGVEEDEE